MNPKLENAIFPVEEKNLYWEDAEEFLDDYKAVIRVDTEELVSIVPHSIVLKTNKEILEKTVGVIHSLGYTPVTDSVNSYLTNQKMIFHILIKEIYIHDGESPINLSLLIRNSYDSSYAFYFAIGTFRSICINGSIIGYKEIADKIYYKHTKRIDISEAERTIKRSINLFPRLEKRINILKNISFYGSPNVVKQSLRKANIIFRSRQFEKYILYNIKVYNIKNLYQFYNEMTSWVTHNVHPLYKESTLQKIAKAFEV